jgi:hypothetical protein
MARGDADQRLCGPCGDTDARGTSSGTATGTGSSGTATGTGSSAGTSRGAIIRSSRWPDGRRRGNLDP